MIKSRWSFETSAGGGLGIGPTSFSGGMFVLNDPSKHPFTFDYRTGGFGLGIGLRLPPRFRLPEIKLPRFISKDGTIAGTGGTSDFDSGGRIYRFNERELLPEDFTGSTLSLEFGGGLLVAESFTVFLTGLTHNMIVPWLFNPGLFTNVLFSTAKAMVVLVGMGEGLVDGISATPMLGTISYAGPYQEESD